MEDKIEPVVPYKSVWQKISEFVLFLAAIVAIPVTTFAIMYGLNVWKSNARWDAVFAQNRAENLRSTNQLCGTIFKLHEQVNLEEAFEAWQKLCQKMNEEYYATNGRK